MTTKWIIALTTAGLLACGRSRSPDASGELRIALDTSRGAREARIVVTGLSRAETDTLRAAAFTSEAWHRLWKIPVAGGDTTPVAGPYAITDKGLQFTPAFPLDPGRAYAIRLDPAQLPRPRVGTIVLTTVALAAKPPTPPTSVLGILPSADTFPENQLRLYIRFSAPMSRAAGLGFIKLLDADGREVRDAFLPLDADFWNADRTRYTVFFDPGRVKRGILPNEQMGRALHAGRAYAIEIDPKWRDAEGQPLAAPFRRAFRAGPADEAPIALAAWRVRAPAVGSRDALVASFPEPLDHGLLERALGVETAAGASVDGDVTIVPGEREWRFTPRAAWRAGPYRLVILSILEDAAGNRVGRAFEVDMFERVDSGTAAERFSLPFTVR